MCNYEQSTKWSYVQDKIRYAPFYCLLYETKIKCEKPSPCRGSKLLVSLLPHTRDLTLKLGQDEAYCASGHIISKTRQSKMNFQKIATSKRVRTTRTSAEIRIQNNPVEGFRAQPGRQRQVASAWLHRRLGKYEKGRRVQTCVKRSDANILSLGALHLMVQAAQRLVRIDELSTLHSVRFWSLAALRTSSRV